MCVCLSERLTEKDTVFVTVGIVSKHMYIHVQKLIFFFLSLSAHSVALDQPFIHCVHGFFGL